ncbi:hypothetical protein CPAR01_00867 [Colletotrichum paranaense]|uniref:Uncharacterized protein n=1 Tax=Colletotrichum paranaense TaxID=1914294 RepID=A0ABQ9T542_9PEZI|nr:uncharacterized protein CPAR01_00867 [Colletotrichum paranaense]KAK1546900.1 hypothetical protein CPAR01_00867 [Colletotrichum paranaense]
MRETLSTFQDSFSHPAEGDPDEGLVSTTEVFRFLLSAIGEEITWYNLLRTGAFPIIYGGIHLSAWNYDFASRQEGIMWKHMKLILFVQCPLAQPEGWLRRKIDAAAPAARASPRVTMGTGCIRIIICRNDVIVYAKLRHQILDTTKHHIAH